MKKLTIVFLLSLFCIFVPAQEADWLKAENILQIHWNNI